MRSSIGASIASPCRRGLALVLTAMLAAGPALAEKPSWAGGEKGGKSHKSDDRGESRGDTRAAEKERGAESHRFGDEHRRAVREYYGHETKGGRCPPGLAKKHNGCMPPGQAKKWAVGRPLPRDVVFYEVPQPLVLQIGVPPAGYRYVRVAGDILMIAIGTSLVVDAIQDLGR